MKKPSFTKWLPRGHHAVVLTPEFCISMSKKQNLQSSKGKTDRKTAEHLQHNGNFDQATTAEMNHDQLVSTFTEV